MVATTRPPAPTPGAFARTRHRHWLVEDVIFGETPYQADLVSLSCIDDDAPGERLTVLWQNEPDAELIGSDHWAKVGARQFDPAERFSAYLHTLRWNCVTATDPGLLQAPFRAGIKLEAYQLEPLRKALLLPRVNLFIADDVGLGKTIEAGLIARELLLRRRIDTIVIAAPPSMISQWRDEMEARFGLPFTVMDREFVMNVRRERGHAINPWTTHSRFLVSHRLLSEEAYTADMMAWLGELRPKSLLILDEAHHAAPASGSKYAIDSQFTRAMRDLGRRFEHRLFLSATPHNGHSNSFAALLTLLDPQRFVRGMKVRKGDLDPVMVRRLKEDIREVRGGFPKRCVEQVDITGLPPDASELVLAEKLAALRDMREQRLAASGRAAQRAGALVIGTLQQRLLSSVTAFARTIRVHRAALERHAPATAKATPARDLFAPLGPDDEDVALQDAERAQLEDAAITTATEQVLPERTADTAFQLELAAVRELEALADANRDRPDARIRWLLEWIDREMCPGVLSGLGEPAWNERRLLIFTEWEDTRRWLEGRLRQALGHSHQAAGRIGSYTGSTTADDRERLKRAFNTPPQRHPLRILIATDAAREGLNLQRHCRDLLHFDLPWNPSRLEQRNGRIDRKLQPAPEVFCRYFFYPQRAEDRVLQALVRKSETIRQQLGSMAQILEGRASDMLGSGIRRSDITDMVRRIEVLSDGAREAAIKEELEEARERQDTLLQQIERLQRQLERSARQIALEPAQFRDTLSASLSLANAGTITHANAATAEHPETFTFPTDTLARDQSWAPTLDLLRAPRDKGETLAEWRARAPVRPVTFAEAGDLGDDVVQLHLEHRVAQRLLARFTSQGLLHLDLSRACLATARQGDPRVVLLGRLSLFGPGAARLHEEIITITARWTDLAVRRGPLRPYGDAGEARTLELLEEALAGTPQQITTEVRDRLLGALATDIADLRPHLETIANDARSRAERLLAQRAERESAEMARLLSEQRSRIEAAVKATEQPAQLSLLFPDEAERRQRQADQRAWSRRLDAITGELEAEPARIRDGYTVRAARIEPVGIVYLWPVSG